MVPAESTHRIHNLIYFTEHLSFRGLIQCMEVGNDLFIVKGAVFVVAFVERGQNRIAITEVRRMFLEMASEQCNDWIRNITFLVESCDVSLKQEINQVCNLPIIAPSFPFWWGRE